MRAGISGIILLLPLVLLAQLFLGCAPAVSQEQYNSLQAELKSTREQLAAKNSELANLKTQPATTPVKDPLATPRKTWSSMQPYMDLNTLLLDDQVTISLQSSKQITTAYANIQYSDQRNRLTELLKRFDDREFAATVESAWSESDSTDPQLKWQYWAKTYTTLRDYLKNNGDKLTGQLNP
jgi:hypothetical protein